MAANHSASRVRGLVVLAEMARLGGEGMLQRKMMRSPITHRCSDGSGRQVII